MAPVDSHVNVYNSLKSVVCLLSGVISDSMHSCVEDNFAHAGQSTAVQKWEWEDRPAFSVDDSSVVQQFSHDDQQQDTLSHTTYLSCTEEMSAKASRLSLLASRAKALCNIVTARNIANERAILSLSVLSTDLTMEYRHHSQSSGTCHCDFLVADMSVSSGCGNTNRSAKRSACSNALSVLLKSYLHLAEGSHCDNMIRLIGSEMPSAHRSYDIVTRLYVPFSDVVLSAFNSSDQQTSGSRPDLVPIIVSLKHAIGMVRTIFHVLETTEGKNWKQIVDMALRSCGLSAEARIVRGQRFCCSLFIDVVLVAHVERDLRWRFKHRSNALIKHCAYAAAFELFRKSYLRLVDSKHGLRLTGSDKPFDEMVSGTLPMQEDDSGDKLEPQEAHHVAEDKLPSATGQNSVMPPTDSCEAKSTSLDSRTVQLRAVNLPAIMARFCHLSSKVKYFSRDRMAVKNDATIMLLALKETKLPSHNMERSKGQSYRCKLWIASVLVASGEGKQKMKARRQTYMHAAELLRKPSLQLAMNCDSSVLLVGSDKVFTQLQSAQKLEIDISSHTAVEPSICHDAENTLLDEKHSSVTGCKAVVQTQSAEASVDGQQLVEYQKTVVTARSHKDLSRLVNKFHFLACMAKDVDAMFKSKKNAKQVFDMAVSLSYMYSKNDLIKRQGGRFCFQLLIGVVLVADAEDYDKKLAREVAYGTAVKVLCMPYLCLEEKLDAVRLFGSNKPFEDLSLEHRDFKVMPYSSQLFWLDSNVTDMADTKDMNVHEPVAALPYDADLSKLVNYFHSVVRKVKALSESSLKFNNDIELIQRILGGKLVVVKTPFIGSSGFGYYCELNISGVEIAYGHASVTKQAKHAAYSAAVELMKKPYLCLQELPELNHSYKLIGSDQPFVGVTSGVLPYEEISVVPDKGKFVEGKQLAKPEEKVGSHQFHIPQVTHDAVSEPVSNESTGPIRASANASCSHQDVETLLAQSLACFVILSNSCKKVKKATMSTLHQSASFNKWPLVYDVATVEWGGCRCRLTLGGHNLAETVTKGRKSAKKTAAEEALKRLSSMCYTLKVKNYDITENALSRDEVRIILY